MVNVETWDSRVLPSSLPSNIRPTSMGCLSCQMAVFDSLEVASSLVLTSSFESPTSCFTASIPRPIMYADCAVVS